uniref:Putative secreted protein n=1 Tax=Ixodes ricinus TaxID=34613 RepID=A0A6B0UW07_IXORI
MRSTRKTKVYILALCISVHADMVILGDMYEGHFHLGPVKCQNLGKSPHGTAAPPQRLSFKVCCDAAGRSGCSCRTLWTPGPANACALQSACLSCWCHPSHQPRLTTSSHKSTKRLKCVAVLQRLADVQHATPGTVQRNSSYIHQSCQHDVCCV